MYRVVLREHEIKSRTATYKIPKTEKLLPGSETHAKVIAIREVHKDAGVPPWKPYIRESWRHASATREDAEA